MKTEDEWKAELAPDRYHVLREKGTEPAWTGALLDVHDPGLFRCAACGAELFRSDDKFDSGSGWPSFTKAVADGVINEHDDSTFGMRRTEVTCARCGGHLGHVFPDGPAPTGQRYCINSLSLEFEPGTTNSSVAGSYERSGPRVDAAGSGSRVVERTSSRLSSKRAAPR